MKCSTEFPRLTAGARIIRQHGAEQTGTIVEVRDDVDIHGALLVEWEPVGGVGGRYCAWTSPFGVDRID